MNVARGSFQVTSTPHPPYDAGIGATLGRVTLQKAFEGDLVGSSTVEMIAARSTVKGSAGYVAIERVSGTLHKDGAPFTGTFVVQHSGTMFRGAQSLSVTIVPDTGTGQLVGINGRFTIEIVLSKHFYTLSWELGA